MPGVPVFDQCFESKTTNIIKTNTYNKDCKYISVCAEIDPHCDGDALMLAMFVGSPVSG